MMKQIMKRAWEIYGTLVGDRIAKMSMALRQAWAEAKAVTKRAANNTDLKIVRAWVAHFFPTLEGLLESQIRKGATVTMYADHTELEIGNIDVEAKLDKNHQMVLNFWYCGNPFEDIA